jgi:hypothetical protein
MPKNRSSFTSQIFASVLKKGKKPPEACKNRQKKKQPNMTMIMIPPSQPPSQRLSPSNADASAARLSGLNVADGKPHSVKHHPPSTTRTKSSPNLLRFNPQVRVRYIPSLDDFSLQEHKDTWYSKDDCMYMRRREKRVTRELSRQVGVSHNNDQERLFRRVSFTQRTLGLQTKEERGARCQHIQVVQFLVLYEQERHGDPERLAWIYSQITLESAQQARDRGISVEVVLRNVELGLDNSHHRGRQSCVDSLPRSRNSNMRHRRWSADSSSSSSLSPLRDTAIIPTRVVH